MDTLEISKSKYLAVVTTIEQAHGKQTALVAQALASFAFSFDATTRILAENHFVAYANTRQTAHGR
jgi:hypothetical protein